MPASAKAIQTVHTEVGYRYRAQPGAPCPDLQTLGIAIPGSVPSFHPVTRGDSGANLAVHELQAAQKVCHAQDAAALALALLLRFSLKAHGMVGS